jgi:AcrR family transcriptional regulator
VTIDETRPGRPRDPTRDEAILDATLELLGEVGYEQVTVRAIAQRAGVGLATLYRRWPTKEELVVDAIACMPEFPDMPGFDPGSDPVEGVVELVSGLLEVLQGPRRELIPTLIGQLPRNPVLADTMRDRVVLPRLAAVTEFLAAVPGVDPDRVRRAAELIPASLYFQVLVLGRRLDDRDARQAVETAVEVARAR